MLFRSNDTATTEIYTWYDTLSLHDALPIYAGEYEQALVAEFESYLPDQPPWHAAKPAK